MNIIHILVATFENSRRNLNVIGVKNHLVVLALCPAKERLSILFYPSWSNIVEFTLKFTDTLHIGDIGKTCRYIFGKKRRNKWLYREQVGALSPRLLIGDLSYSRSHHYVHF